MTRGQQLVLVVMVILLFGVIAVLAYTLINTDDAASTVPTLAAMPGTGNQSASVGEVSITSAPPTWTPEPTRTSVPSDTPRPTNTAAPPPTITPTFLPTFTPQPTEAITATPTVVPATATLENPGFAGIGWDDIPGWSWWAADNYPDDEYDSQTSFDTPFFSRTDDPARVISGSTLQMEATAFVNFRVHLFQTVSAPPTVTVRFQASAKAYSNSGGIRMAAGIDPDGGLDCTQARWGDSLTIDQSSGTVHLIAPDSVVGPDGQVTVCLCAENVNPGRSNAAFFDTARLIANPQ